MHARRRDSHLGAEPELVAVDDVSFTVEAGEIFGLLGPNGAGKSTTMMMLAGLLRPDSGIIKLDGGEMAPDNRELRTALGVVPQDLAIYPDLSARENLEFFGRLYGLRGATLQQSIDAALTAARLQERAQDRVAGFSRGLRQRLALERALLHRPRLVLLDEPFTGLDDDAAAALGGRLRTLRDAGAIVVMATHDFESADQLVDRAVCLKEGRAREIAAGSGTIRERYRRSLQEAWA